MTRLSIAVVGSGISGLAAAWLTSRAHDVTLFEADSRLGGHTNTVDMDIDGSTVPVDTGFICYNDATYPNLIALFEHLGVEAHDTSMSFSASMEGGNYEYSGGTWSGLAAQPSNLLRAGHWRMLRDIARFFREAGDAIEGLPEHVTIGEWIESKGYGPEFRDRHLIPMAAAIWSSSTGDMMAYPARAFLRFFQNHGLIQLYRRPQWKSVLGGSRTYIDAMQRDGDFQVVTDHPVRRIERRSGHALVFGPDGMPKRFDHVIIATHADQALDMLADADSQERALLGAFDYSMNHAVLHRDRRLMPRRKLAWASWNYIELEKHKGRGERDDLCLTYWMNSLQQLPTQENVFVTLNPPEGLEIENLAARFDYAHPIFDAGALEAQANLWSLQGVRNTWFCGAHFGAGFHEDGLQSGLAVAEQLGGVRRPWDVENENGRIRVSEVGRFELPVAAE